MIEGPSSWMETDAVVTSCRFQFARLNTLRLGVQRGEKFRIGFDYYALTTRYSDEFQSPVAIAQGERFKVRYNPAKPQQNSRSSSDSNFPASGRRSLVTLGIGGSILLSLIWLEILRGCR